PPTQPPTEQVTQAPATEPPTAAPTAEATGEATDEGNLTTIDGFKVALQKALTDRDFELLALLMIDNNFKMGFWQSEGTEASPIEAASALITNYSTSNVPIVIADQQPDFDALLGTTAKTFFGPDVNPEAI